MIRKIVAHRISWLILLLVFIISGCDKPPLQDSSTQNPQIPESVDSVPEEDEETPVIQRHAPTDNSNLLLGDPSNATRDPNNYFLDRSQYVSSYNRSQGGPNWVAWHVDENDLGAEDRGDFQPDPLLPSAWRIRPNAYRGSGYDRGHICPSGDRTATRADNDATFMMSNMLPQTPDLNRQLWKSLEDYTRSLVHNDNEVYVMAGGVGSAGRIADGQINVPQTFWKIITVLPRGNSDLARINENTRVIAVSMPNEQGPNIANGQWQKWTTSVAEIEQATGYTFFSALPDHVKKVLEKKVDSGSLDNPTPVPADSPAQASTAQKVWVNTNSGIYHFPGSEWYGKTKKGAFMDEAEAKNKGFRAAK